MSLSRGLKHDSDLHIPCQYQDWHAPKSRQETEGNTTEDLRFGATWAIGFSSPEQSGVSAATPDLRLGRAFRGGLHI